MSKARKLQQEIDGVLRKVHDGVEQWADDWEKLEATEDASQREKLIEGLKRDLKKLQRLRETVRGWLASGELKGDDGALQDARRAIENHMESFKRLEKDMKTKAFSTAGLNRDDTDPAVIAKVRCADWLNEIVTRLETQTEAIEADLESLGPMSSSSKSTGRGKGSRGAVAERERAATLSAQLARHRDYLVKIERTLRLLENDQVTPDEVENALKDSLEYYIESYADDDFMEDDSMWEMLPLDNVDECVGKITAHKAHVPSAGTAVSNSESIIAVGEEGRTEAATGGKAAIAKVKPTSVKIPLAVAEQSEASMESTATAPPPPPPSPPKKVSSLVGASGHVSMVTSPRKGKAGAVPLMLGGKQGPTPGVPPPPPPPPPGFPAQSTSPKGSALPSPIADLAPQLSSPFSHVVATSLQGAPAIKAQVEGASGEVSAQTSAELLTGQSPFAGQANAEFSPQGSGEATNGGPLVVPSTHPEDVWPSGSWVEAADVENGGPEAVARGAVRTLWKPTLWDLGAIESGLMYRPIPSDAEWIPPNGDPAASDGSGKPWRPPHPVVTPPSYPTEVHPTLRQEVTYKTLPQDTLFFAFYFHGGSRQQGFAASALKSQGWRFHTAMRAWFARTGQPTNATATYEEGPLAYWEPTLRMVDGPTPGAPPAMVGWRAGTTPPTFRFEYALLENEDINIPSG